MWAFVGIGSPRSPSPSEFVSPLDPKGGGATLSCRWKGSETQFRRLERKPDTMYTLWVYGLNWLLLIEKRNRQWLIPEKSSQPGGLKPSNVPPLSFLYYWLWVDSHSPSIRSHRGFPDYQPMRLSEEPVCIYVFFTSLHLRSPVHVVPHLHGCWEYLREQQVVECEEEEEWAGQLGPE